MEDLLELCKEALMNAKGAYNALKTMGADKHLPGYDRCNNKCDEALKALKAFKYL